MGRITLNSRNPFSFKKVIDSPDGGPAAFPESGTFLKGNSGMDGLEGKLFDGFLRGGQGRCIEATPVTFFEGIMLLGFGPWRALLSCKIPLFKVSLFRGLRRCRMWSLGLLAGMLVIYWNKR